MLTVSSTIKSYPALPYPEMALAVLGASWDVSLTFIGPDRARTLNQTYRHKDYVPNVLSFPLASRIGEIYICPAVANTEAHDYSLSPTGYIGFLFIHGLLHLKGYDHGPQMERLERKFSTLFHLT